jgi:hypothetical protein
VCVTGMGGRKEREGYRLTRGPRHHAASIILLSEPPDPDWTAVAAAHSPSPLAGILAAAGLLRGQKHKISRETENRVGKKTICALSSVAKFC